jgi:NAD(P)-dependent dehydrogenase (short-subunit alcohol dehydrogenase family)
MDVLPAPVGPMMNRLRDGFMANANRAGPAPVENEAVENERVLLAGCGDLGLRVAQRLLARGDEVWALRRRPPVDDDSGVRWLRGDLTHADSLQRLACGITQLVYLPTPDRRDEAAYRATFVDGLRHVLDALAVPIATRAAGFFQRGLRRAWRRLGG